MGRRLTWDPRARADINMISRQNHRLADRIVQAIESFAMDGRGDVRKLQGRLNEFRLRVGDWRVMFTLDDAGREMAVSRILNRRDAYRG